MTSRSIEVYTQNEKRGEHFGEQHDIGIILRSIICGTCPLHYTSGKFPMSKDFHSFYCTVLLHNKISYMVLSIRVPSSRATRRQAHIQYSYVFLIPTSMAINRLTLLICKTIAKRNENTQKHQPQHWMDFPISLTDTFCRISRYIESICHTRMYRVRYTSTTFVSS